ncbi:MAG: endonuclease/exonuclease/phosphatase family protein, partial [Bacteroidales bacterium]|nr:endonuclease/exonuclease/phosphatase family protein [Bacteroidales bacterium]
AGYSSLYYQGAGNIYDIILVSKSLADASPGTFQIQPIVNGKYYGRVFNKPFMTNQSGQYKGTPFRTFSNGAFVGGYSDHYPTYIVIKK